MKKNSKGFVLLETLIVATFVLGTLIFLYVQFSAVNRNYEISFRYNTISGLYDIKMLSEYLVDNGYETMSANLDKSENGYVDISACSATGGGSLCDKIIKNINASKVILIGANITNLQAYLKKSGYNSTLFDNELKKFILTTDTISQNSKNRIIIEFNDNTFAVASLGRTINLNFLGYKTGTTSVINESGTIYFNPVDNKGCTLEDYTNNTNASITGTQTGCMKWYVIKDSDSNQDTVDVILDHNTTAVVAYDSIGNNTIVKEAQTELNNLVNGSNWKITPRLITADEIANITDNKIFKSETSTSDDWFYFDSNNQTQVANDTTKSNYSWLYDYTKECTAYGCNVADSSNYGYWTSTPVFGDTSNAWNVGRNGDLHYYDYEVLGVDYGVRPVITISKGNL